VIFGKNPLPIYVLSEILGFFLGLIIIRPGVDISAWSNTAIFQAIAPGAICSLLFALTYMFICWVVAWVLDRRKVYIRV
jgi:predicted acyltransferase